MVQNNKPFSRFLMIWFGQLISSIGSGLTAFALGVYVFTLTGSATNFSLVLLAAFLPAQILKPIGGALSDRMDRRVLMVIGDLGAAIGLFFIISMLLMGIAGLWVIYTGVIVSSVFTAVQNPAYKATVTDLVDEAFYAKASGLMQLSESSKFLIAPLIAGVLLKLIGIKPLLILDMLTFIVAIIPIFWVKRDLSRSLPQDLQTSGFITDIINGFHFVYSNKGLMWLLSITSLITFFVGVLQALLGPMILAIADAETLGFAQFISTLGMLVSGCFIGVFSQATKPLTMLSLGLGFGGVFFALMGISTHIGVITLFGFLFFLALPFINTSLDVLVRKNIPNEMQGRTWSIVSLISQFGMLVAFGLAGYLADSVFNPLLYNQGLLASSIGVLIGTGDGRGIGLMFIISGIMVSITAIIMTKFESLKTLDG